jgi:hypothetical protein
MSDQQPPPEPTPPPSTSYGPTPQSTPPPSYGPTPQPTPPPPYGQPAPAGRSPVLSILSLIGGILGVVFAFFLGAGIVFAIAGVVLGFVAQRKEPEARGLWLTGLILGFVGVVLSLLFLVLLIVGFVLAAQSGYVSR